jgi:hypothetical protein
MLLDEGKNLFLVFGIGSFGEPPLPPSRMLLPEGITDHRCEASYVSECQPRILAF